MTDLAGPGVVNLEAVPEATSPLPGSTSHQIPLGSHLNNIGATSPHQTGVGSFNIWGNSFPAEEMPPAGPLRVAGVDFDFPPTGQGQPDNVRADGQLLTVVPDRYDWLHVIGAGERRVDEELLLHFTDGAVDSERLRLSDFWVAPAVFGEVVVRATQRMHYPFHVQSEVSAMLWCQRVPVTRRAPMTAIRLPRNPALHIFAATLVRDAT